MENLSYTFKCSHCNEILNKDYFIELSFKRNNGNSGKVFLSPKVGTYDILVDYNVRFHEQECVEFFCNKCGRSLNSSRHPDFAALNLCVNDNCKFEIIFSKFFGDRRTLVITEEEESLCGKSLENYLTSEDNIQKQIA
jgi:hypothetical protein